MEKKDGIYDAAGRYLAPVEGNQELPAPPARLCQHGQLCKACGKA